MNSKLVAGALSVLVLTGCGTIPAQKMDANVGNALNGQTVVRTTGPTPDFAVMTLGKSSLGLLGAAMMISEGNRLVLAYKIPDPAVQISVDLVAALREQRGAVESATAVDVISTEAAEIGAAFKGAGRYVLDVRTKQWVISHFPTDWIHYQLRYTAHARLIDTETNAVVAQGSCESPSEGSAGAPTHDEMMAENAAWIRLEMARVASICVDKLRADMLAL